MDGIGTATDDSKNVTYPFSDLPDTGDCIEVASGVFWVRLPLFDRGVKFFNAWVLEDDEGLVIVDTGLDNPPTREFWTKILQEKFNNRPIKKVIGTHMHPDHIGLAGWFVNKEVPLYMTRLEYLYARMIADDQSTEPPKEAVWHLTALGSGEKMIEDYKYYYGIISQMVQRFPASFIRLQDGDKMKINGKIWEVVVGSGHSPEHACLYCPELKIFISGDQVLPRISSHVGAFYTEPEGNNLKDWLQSCRDIPKRVPNDVLVLPAHNEPFYGLHDRLKALISYHEKKLEKLVKLCKDPISVIDDEVFTLLFNRKISSGILLLAGSESLANFNYLQSLGKVKRVDKNGIIKFQAC